MAVGLQGNNATMDQALTSLAVQLRNTMYSISNLNSWINGQGNGSTVLADLGYSTVPSSTNPGGVSDAQFASSMLSYLNTMAAVYNGTAAQTPAFNFNQELSQLWAGQ
jgi:hypothetical protein